MKKGKKYLSLLLATVLAFSVCTVGITAFAEAGTPLEELVKSITEMETKDDLTLAMQATYKGLQDAEKDSIEPKLLHKLYNFSFSKFTGGRPTTLEVKIGKVKTAVGDLTPNMKLGVTMGTQLSGVAPISYTVDGTAGSMKMPATINFADPAQVAVYKEWAKLVENKENPFISTIAQLQTYVSALVKVPFFGDVELLDESYYESKANVYKADFAFFELKNQGKTSEEMIDYFANTYQWAPKDAPIGVYIKKVGAANKLTNDYVKGTLSRTQYIEKMNGFSVASLPVIPDRPQLAIFEMLSRNEIGEITSSWSAQAEAARANEASYKTAVEVQRFCTAVMEVAVPDAPSAEFNKVIASLRKWFTDTSFPVKMESFAKDNKEVFARYTQLMALTFDDVSVKADPIHKGFEEEFVDYQMGKPYGAIITDTLVPSIDAIVSKALPQIADGKSLRGILEQLLFKNENIKDLVVMISGVLEPNQTPATMATRFAEFPETAAVAERLKKYASFADLPADFDWGVKKGDYKSFFEAFVVGGGGLVGVIEVLLGNVNVYDSEGNLTAINPPNMGGLADVSGLYEKVILPLMEALGGENLMSSVEYTGKMELVGTSATLEGRYGPLLDVIDQLYEQVIIPLLDSPVDFLSKNLPNLIYHLEDGCIFEAIEELLKGVEAILGGNQEIVDIVKMIRGYLSLDGIWGAVEPFITNAGINLKLQDILAFGKLGKATVVPSSQLTYTNTIRVIGNRQSVVNQLAKILEPIALKLLGSVGVDFAPKGEFVRVEVPAYPHNGKMDKKVVSAMITGFDGLLGGLLNINDLINNGLCTNEMAGTIIKGLYGALAGIDLSSLTNLGIKLTLPSPNDIAAMLPEKKFAALAEELSMQSNKWEDIAFTIKNDNEVIKQIDMGFKNGDRDGFVATVVASLRPLVKFLVNGNLVVNSMVGGTQAYGLYETVIIPVFEAIGLTPATDSATYTKNFEQLMKKVPTLAADATAEQKANAMSKTVVAYDYLVNTILAPVLGLLKDLGSAPLDTLLRVLPNLVYAIQYNPTLAFVGNLLSKGTGKIDVAGMLNGLIGGLLPGFELPPLDLNAIISAGTLTEVSSKSATSKTLNVIKASKEDEFVTVYYYLYDAINYKDNMKVIKTLLGGIDGMDATLSGLIDSVLGQVFTASKEESLCILGTILASDVWECPDGTVGGPNKGTNTGAGNKTPATGDSIAIASGAFLVMLTTAGIAIVLLRKKQKVS